MAEIVLGLGGAGAWQGEDVMRVGEFVGEAHPAGETAVEDRTQGNGLGQVGGADAVRGSSSG